MAAGSLLALLDDIPRILDDVSVMTKVAAKKTAGVLGDDLALNAQQVTGVNAERELPVVWAVAKGSFVNKLLLVPSALAISYVASWAITPLLMIGGAYLCFEGVEKLAHKFLHAEQKTEAHENELKNALGNPKTDMVALEQEKIKGAVRIDFVLSAEIIVIALGSAAASGASFAQQATVVAAIALIMTVGVYGLVAGIVKLDDLGLHLLLKKGSNFYRQLQRKIGEKILVAAPLLMKLLSVVGTAAMFLVGGGIIVHGVPALHHAVEAIHMGAIIEQAANALIGMVVGAIVLLLLTGFKKLKLKS